MAVSYNRLWKLLIDRKMSKADLRKAAGLAPNTMTKLRRDEPVAMGVLEKICGTIICLLNAFQRGDIVAGFCLRIDISFRHQLLIGIFYGNDTYTQIFCKASFSSINIENIGPPANTNNNVVNTPRIHEIIIVLT